MSKFVKIQTELRDLALVKRSLDELQIPYTENARFTHIWSGYSGQLPIVVEQKRVKFGLREMESGAYEVVADDMQMVHIRPVVEKLQQRYAYHKVLAEVEKAGFSLVDEQTGRDQAIRMTVRRWS